MQNRYILTPYFLDREEPGLETAAGPEWHLNRVDLPEGSQQQRMIALYRPLANFVAAAAAAGDRPVSLAGDCCTSIAVLAGLQRAGLSPTLLWLDAHGDFNTWETTPSGFLGGMPLAMLVGRGEQTLVQGVGLTPLPEARVILSDARDLDPGEKEAVAGARLTHVPDVAALLDQPLPAGPLYVHWDTDVVDPAEAPAMNYPTPGGPPVETLRRVFRRLAGSGQVAAISVSAWAPALDEDGQSERTLLALLQALLEPS
jgi:arginase